MHLPGKETLWMDAFTRRDFEVNGCTVTVICPPRPLEKRYWAWKGEFLDAFPETEMALLRKGFYIVYLEFQNQYGSPAAVAKWNDLHACLTGDFGFAQRPALIGLSRGGLYCYNWAAANPDKVACIYGDAPVCDLRSWPGGKGVGRGSPADWQRVMDVYGFASEADTLAYDGNPVDALAPLAAARIPLLHVFGDADESVPWEENTGVVTRRYRELGGSIELIRKPGCGHHPHGLKDPMPIVKFIVKHTITPHNC